MKFFRKHYKLEYASFPDIDTYPTTIFANSE